MLPHQLTRESIGNLDEAQLRRAVLIPLLNAMGFQGVREYHGQSGEQGKDIIMWRPDELGHREHYAIVALTSRISGSVEGTSTRTVTPFTKVYVQIQQCFGSDFNDLLSLSQQRVDRCWVVTSGEVKKEARTALSNVLRNTPYERLVRIIDGDELWRLVEQHLKPHLIHGALNHAHSTLRALDQDYYIEATVGGPHQVFSIRPKHRDAPPVSPISFTPKFEFPDTPDGRNARLALDRWFKTGAPARLPGEYITEFEASPLLKALLGPDEISFREVIIGAGGLGSEINCDLVMENPDGREAVLHGIKLRAVQAGTEEATLSNHHDNHPYKLEVVINWTGETFTLHTKYKLEGVNVKRQLELVRFRHAMSRGGVIRLISSESGLLILSGGPIAECRYSEIPDAAISTLEQLYEIQMRTGIPLSLPRELEQEDAEIIYMVAEVVKTGERHWGAASISFSIDRKFADNLVNLPDLGENDGFYFVGEGTPLNVCGTDIHLGPCVFGLRNGYVPPEVKQRIQRELTTQPERNSFTATLATDVGISAQYIRWLPEAEQHRLRELFPSLNGPERTDSQGVA